jgi:hypothetical protein
VDLSAYDTTLAEQGVSMPVKHPITGEPFMDEQSGEPVSLILLGEDSPEHRQFWSEVRRRNKGKDFDLDMFTADELAGLVACTVRMNHVALGSDVVGADKSKIQKAYVKLPWLREQALAFHRSRANFLPNAPTS